MTTFARCSRCGGFAPPAPAGRAPYCDFCRARIQTCAHLDSIAAIAARLGDQGAASRIRGLRDELDVLPPRSSRHPRAAPPPARGR